MDEKVDRRSQERSAALSLAEPGRKLDGQSIEADASPVSPEPPSVRGLAMRNLLKNIEAESLCATPSDINAIHANVLQQALALLALGLRPFPVDTKNRKPFMGEKWEHLQDRPPTEEEVVRAFTAYPAASIACVTGYEGGLDVVDLDVDDDGRLPEWPGDPNKMLPVGCVLSTPDGGRHHLMRHTPGVRNSAGKIAPHVDVRGTGGYAVIWGPGRGVLTGSFAEALQTEAPEWLRQDLLANRNGKRLGKSGRRLVGPIIPDGERNVTLASLAGSMRHGGMCPEAITAALLEQNAQKCKPPLREEEVRSIAQSIGRYPPADSAYKCTDSGNSERFVSQWKNEVRWCAPLNRWFAWDGRRWSEDSTERLMGMAKRTARTIYGEAGATEDDARRSVLAKWAPVSEQESKLRAMVNLAKPDLAILPDALDSDPMLFNCLNGTLDLQTGELREHKPSDYITKLAPVEYHPDAKDEVWDRYLADTSGGDPTFASYLQRFAGYCLTGRTDEEIFALILGPAATGKTTWVQALLAVLGDYAVKAQFDTFLERRDVGGPRSDLAALRGARMVAAVETAATRKLAEPLVKELVGGDSITVSAKYAHPITFKPQCKLILAANEAPRMSSDDGALWRRAKMLPFKHVVTNPDPAVKAHLSQPNAALLAWAVQGCLAWQKDGLGACVAVTSSTDALREEMNPLVDFLACCAMGDQYEAPAGDLRQAYQEYARQEGGRPIGGRMWGQALQSAGCRRASRKVNGRAVRYWVGVGLQDTQEESVTGANADGSPF